MVLIFHGRKDRRVRTEQDVDYHYALRRHKQSVRLLVYDSLAYPMDAPESWDDAMIASVQRLIHCHIALIVTFLR
jgi:hypothetical protein